jgi:hypothetical protein
VCYVHILVFKMHATCPSCVFLVRRMRTVKFYFTWFVSLSRFSSVADIFLSVVLASLLGDPRQIVCLFLSCWTYQPLACFIWHQKTHVLNCAPLQQKDGYLALLTVQNSLSALGTRFWRPLYSSRCLTYLWRMRAFAGWLG